MHNDESLAYDNVALLIDGEWRQAVAGESLAVLNPATEKQIGRVSLARQADLDLALAAAQRGFAVWSQTPPLQRAKVLSGASALLRQRVDHIGRLLTLEQGKPLAEARGEIERVAEMCDWMAGETQRIYGRLIAARSGNVTQMVVKEPVGIVAAFTPWNFPVNQIVRKVATALAAGCSIIVKGAEETPASCAELVRAFMDAGAAKGSINLVFGIPAEISGYLVPHPLVRKISFTGSTAVGKQLAALAGQHMKLATMELGGHAPTLIFSDCNIDSTAKALVAGKFRNAGQICISPTRFLVERPAYDRFVDIFVETAKSIKVGFGLDASTQMGPLANGRRVEAMQRLTADAIAKGAKLRLGGRRVQREGFFFEPTVVTDVPLDAALMNEEPFGPVAIINPFDDLDAAITEANRLPFGLAAYAFTGSAATAKAVAGRIESGMVSVNHIGLGLPETPFGGMKDSGHGSEGGSEAIEAYLQTRFITMAGLG
ncbi:MAG TPA: NAD-dependent succinate-semialdehyde dehydrogenase [Rhizomicrobium sp.]|nr:NAD-dependent succinate-semialdehyde dehydrogenase [Rhizomicrobium sp.]